MTDSSRFKELCGITENIEKKQLDNSFFRNSTETMSSISKFKKGDEITFSLPDGWHHQGKIIYVIGRNDSEEYFVKDKDGRRYQLKASNKTIKKVS